MQWLPEACGSQVESYFHVAAHFPICSFLRHKHRPHGCLPTAAILLGHTEMMFASPSLFKRVNNFGRQDQLRCQQYEAHRSFHFHTSQCRSIVVAVNHTPAVHRSLSYRHLHHARLEMLLLLEPAVMLHTSQLSAAACKWIIPNLSSPFPSNIWHHAADSASLYSQFPFLCNPRLRHEPLL